MMNFFNSLADKMNLSKRTRANIREWVESIVIALVLALIVRTFIVQAFSIPSGSMRNTLIERDRILVNKFIYRFKDPQLGDIVVFKYPEDRKKYFVKRLIGKPNEVVSIRNGDIYVNGEKVESSEFIKNNFYYNKGIYGAMGEDVKVPEDSYFVLGDNSASSRDSRYWGFVPRKDIKGKVFFRYWPIRRIGKVE